MMERLASYFRVAERLDCLRLPTETRNMNRILAFIIVFVVTVVVLVAGLHWYSQTVLSPPVLPPEEPPEILSYTTLVEENSVKYLLIEGEVKNNLRTGADVNVTGTFYDAENNLLGNVTRRALLKPIKLGQKAPFIIPWPLNFSAGVIPKFELSLSYTKVTEEPQDTLEILYSVNSTDESGYYRVNGTVRNNGNRKVLSASVICTFYDSAGNVTLVSIDSLNSISADHEASFELSSAPYKVNPASYSLAVVAYGYESVFIQNYVPFIVLVLILVIVVVYLKRRGW